MKNQKSIKLTILALCLCALATVSFGHSIKDIKESTAYSSFTTNLNLKTYTVICKVTTIAGNFCYVTEWASCEAAFASDNPPVVKTVFCLEIEAYSKTPVRLIDKSGGKVSVEVNNDSYPLASDKFERFLNENDKLIQSKKITNAEFEKRLNTFKSSDDEIVSEGRLQMISRVLNTPIIKSSDTSGQSAMCGDKTSVAASGRFDKKSFVITVAESGNTYRDGKIQRPVKSSAKLDKEEIVVNRFQSAVNKFFAETPAENLAGAALDYEALGKQMEDYAAAREGCLLVKTSNGVLVSIPTDDNAQNKSLGGPVKGVKVGLGKNPSGAKLAVGSTDGDNQDGTRKWTITFDEETAVKVWQSQSKAQRGITLVKWRENLANEFTATLNKLFPAPRTQK